MRERDEAERGEDPRAGAHHPQHQVALAKHRPRLERDDRQPIVDRAQQLPHTGQHQRFGFGGRGARRHVDRDAGAEVLRQRTIHLRSRAGIVHLMEDRRRDADDLDEFFGLVAQVDLQLPADRILVAEDLARQRFVDDGDRQARRGTLRPP